ncbi:diphthine synthase [Candidatus Marsarchaeota archaeon]|jgi:diphthine synthase|nr:diphthine synthase [Candidatus Marsarchaeota archaeon]
MLYLIGLGVGERDITRAGIEAIKDSEVLILDRYTAFVDSKKLEFIGSISKTEMRSVGRSELEEGIPKIISEAKTKNVSIITNGDPMLATTHKTILVEAAKGGVDFKVIHSTSIFSVAIAESGLDFYRFGSTCTVPRWSEHYKPVSFYETVSANISGNRHSLILLDYDNEKGMSIRIEEAIAIMSKAEEHYKLGIFSKNKEIMALCDVGTENQRIMFKKIGNIDTDADYKMATLIMPAKLSEIETEYLKRISMV